MRPWIKEFVAIVAKTLTINEPICEFGSLQVSEQKGEGDLRHLFPGLEYIGADMREGPGVDKVLNLHKIDLPDESVGTVLCLDTLEHVEHPHRALEEIHRILKPGGIAVISSVMDFPIHDHPYDYWRFTPEGFRSLLAPFNDSFVGSVGRERFPHTIVGLGFKGGGPNSRFEREFELWKARQEARGGLSMLEWLRRLITPPIMSPRARKRLGLTIKPGGSRGRKPKFEG